MEKISKKQLKTIWWMGHKLGFDEEGVHELVWRITGNHSISHLDSVQGVKVIKELIEMGAPPPVPQPGERSGKKKKKGSQFKDTLTPATEKQKRMIHKLASKVIWRKKDGFKRWMLTSYGISEIKTHWDVTMVKQGLLSLLRQQRHIKN